MNRYLLITVFAVVIYESTPTADPQLVPPYQLAFSSYYQSAPAPYYQPAVYQEQTALGPYCRHYLSPYRSQEQNYYGLGELADYKEVYENTPTANPPLASPYQLVFSSYNQQAPAPYYHPLHYYQPAPYQEQAALGFSKRHYLSPYRSQEQNYYGFRESADYKQENYQFFNIFSRVCPTASTIVPCTCQRKKTFGEVPYGSISCPEGQTAATIQQILGRISAGFNIKTVTLQLNRGTNVANAVSAAFTSNYPMAAISIVNPSDPNKCIDSTLLAPCTCSLSKTTCPSGTTIAQIKAAYSQIASNTNLGSVVLNLPADSAISIPNNLLGSNPATTIELIGSDTTKKSLLAIAPGAFASSATTATQLKISNFDVVITDYSFLTDFNALTTIEIKNCVNCPTVADQPKNLPKSLPKLITVFINGVNIYTPNGR